MSLSHGKRLGPYEILDPIGAGGMGEVYRARDLRLDRMVAIKVLGAAMSSKPTARARFEREARVISGLSHPHICALYDVGHEEDVDYIVMEYLQGETLAQRLERGSLRLDLALRHAVEIADGLDSAHRSGVVHRDLKPSNVMLTTSGAKLLDFGLAKLHSPEPIASALLSSMTTTAALTGEGTLLGTLPYMSPEQLEGREADARSDIFSFGAMLHEMLTRRRPFDGGSQAALIAAILSADPPPPSSVQTQCPPELDHVVARCLAKDPEERWQSARDVLLEIQWASRPGAVRQGRTNRLQVVAWAAGAALASALLVAAWWQRSGAEALPTMSPRQVTMAPGWESAPALSPDGGLIAYFSDESGNPDIWIVDVRGGNAVRLTDDPAPDRDPAWFPDGGAIAFVSERGGQTAIWKVMRLGGAASLLLADAQDPAISPDGTQVAFARSGPTGQRRIWVAPLSAPPEARMLTRQDHGASDHEQPAWSPDGRTICYQAARDLWLASVDGRTIRRLTRDDEADIEPAWSPDGRLVYFSSLRGGAWALWRAPLAGGRAQRITLGTGPERHPTLAQGGRRLSYSTFAATSDLMLMDLATRKETPLRGLSPISPAWAPDGRQVVFVSARIGGRYDLWIQPVSDQGASGPARRLTDQPGSVAHPAFSPDGKWVAYYRVVAGQRDIWIVPAAGGDPVQITDDPAADVHPAWSPDGTQLAFASERGGAYRIWVTPVVDGHAAGAPRRLTAGPTTDTLPAWSPDGKWIAYVGVASTGAPDVWVVDASGAGHPRLLDTEGHAGAVAWDRGANALFVSGRWDTWVSLRKYALDTGRRIPLDPPIRFGQNPDLFEFGMSQDGRALAFGRDQVRGDIWVLEAQDRPF